jgi:hypothetical protein
LAWKVFLATLPPAPRAVARLLTPLRGELFADELRIYGRLVDKPSQAQLAWTRDYISHPRYRKDGFVRRFGLRSRVGLLDAWARSQGAGDAGWTDAVLTSISGQIPSSGK